MIVKRERNKSSKSNTSTKSKRSASAPSELIVHYTASRNNAIVSVTNISGDVLCWTSIGAQKIKNSKKRTPRAAETAGFALGEKLQAGGIVSASIRPKLRIIIKGFILSGNYAPFINALRESLRVKDIARAADPFLVHFDAIEVPVRQAFNGPRARKRRRS